MDGCPERQLFIFFKTRANFNEEESARNTRKCGEVSYVTTKIFFSQTKTKIDKKNKTSIVLNNSVFWYFF